MSNSVFLDICIGDHDHYESLEKRYNNTCDVLKRNAEIYGLPTTPDELSEEQQDILRDLDKSPEGPLFVAPTPLLAGRLVFELDASQGLSKTSGNFSALCTGEKGACKQAPTKKLHYLECPIHRIVKGFVAQGGDVTRGDGSGGESVYGGKFNDDKPGLKVKASKGALAMANSGKNSNSSQFFVVLTDDEAQLAKITGKYVIFGQLKAGWEVLQKLDQVGTTDGKPTTSVWISSCGKC